MDDCQWFYLGVNIKQEKLRFYVHNISLPPPPLTLWTLGICPRPRFGVWLKDDSELWLETGLKMAIRTVRGGASPGTGRMHPILRALEELRENRCTRFPGCWPGEEEEGAQNSLSKREEKYQNAWAGKLPRG